MVEVIDGEVEVELRFEPRPEYGRHAARLVPAAPLRRVGREAQRRANARERGLSRFADAKRLLFPDPPQNSQSLHP